MNRRRIACLRRWEQALPRYLFGTDNDLGELAVHTEAETALFRLYLQQARSAIQGKEAAKILALYYHLGLDKDLEQRLGSRSARKRALAATEIGLFEVARGYPLLLPRLYDPRGYVAFAAARSLCQSRDLAYAPQIMAWIKTQAFDHAERMAGILDPLCPALIPWMEDHLADPRTGLREWHLFARLVSVHRYWKSIPTLLALLKVEDVELRCSVLHTFKALANPEPWDAVLPLATHPDALLRMHALQALGNIGGPKAIPMLLKGLADPSFDVRRSASMALAEIGPAGMDRLQGVVSDPEADPFARDMARERLDWVASRRRL